MNKIVIVYSGKYGSTQRYACWLGKVFNAKVVDRKQMTIENLLYYETIIYGGALYAGGILGFDLVRDHFECLRGKHLIVFTVGASPADDEAMKNIKWHNFSVEMEESIDHFHLRGAFDYTRLRFWDRVKMGLLKLKIKYKKPVDRTRDEVGMLAVYQKPIDWTRRENLVPIIECILAQVD